MKIGVKINNENIDVKINNEIFSHTLYTKMSNLFSHLLDNAGSPDTVRIFLFSYSNIQHFKHSLYFQSGLRSLIIIKGVSLSSNSI